MQLYSNNASTTLTGSINSSATVIAVADSSAFPSPGPGDFFLLTLSDGVNIEICNGIANDTTNNLITIERGREGTTAQDFLATTVCSLRATAATYASFLVDAPSDNRYYGRRNGDWEEVPTGGGSSGRLTQDLGSGGFAFVIEDLTDTERGRLVNSNLDVHLIADNQLELRGTTIVARDPAGNALPAATGQDEIITLGRYDNLVPPKIALNNLGLDFNTLSYDSGQGVFSQLSLKTALNSGLSINQTPTELEFSAPGLLDKATYEPDLGTNTVFDKLVRTSAAGTSVVGSTIDFVETDGAAPVASLTADAQGKLTISGDFEVTGVATWNNIAVPSDMALKQDVEIFEAPHQEMLRGLFPIEFAYKRAPSRRVAGFSAKELRELLPTAVSKLSDGTLAIDYIQVVAAMWSVIQQLAARVDALEDEQ